MELTTDWVEALAGPGPTAFLRGMQYAEDGHVTSLERSGRSVGADVQGTFTYRVAGRLDSADWTCECPAADGGVF